MKKVLMLIMTMIMVSGVAKAQTFSQNKVYIYVKAGDDPVKASSCPMFMYVSGDLYCKTTGEHGWNLKKSYGKDPTFKSYLVDSNGRIKSDYYGVNKLYYDSSNSTSKRTTYRYNLPTGDKYYYSFSKDGKSMIKWYSYTDHREYYTQVELSEFAPKSQNRDFLYE